MYQSLPLACIIDFSRGVLVYHICLPADRAELARHIGTEINRGVEVVDLVVKSVVVAPAFPTLILRGIRAAEMVHAALFPPFGVDLRPFHHSVAAKRSISNLGSPAFRLLRVVVRIQIMVYNAGVSQHTRTWHKFLARGKVPVSVAETAAEIHLGRREIRVVNIVRIRNTSARAAGDLTRS